MRAFYLTACLLLGTSAVLAAVSVIKYDYKYSTEVNDDLSYVPLIENPKAAEKLSIREVEVIYEREAFNEFRGKGVDSIIKVPTPPTAQKFSFELRGLTVVGDKKAALISAKAVSIKTPIKYSRSKDRTSKPLSLSSKKVHVLTPGEEIPGTDCILKSISGNAVTIADNSGKELDPVYFSLVSDESLKRAEQIYKNELLLRKKKAPKNSTKPTSMAKEKAINSTTREDR